LARKTALCAVFSSPLNKQPTAKGKGVVGCHPAKGLGDMPLTVLILPSPRASHSPWVTVRPDCQTALPDGAGPAELHPFIWYIGAYGPVEWVCPFGVGGSAGSIGMELPQPYRCL